MSDDALERMWKEAYVVWSRYCSGVCLEGLRKPLKSSVRIANIPSEIWTEHFSNTDLELQLQTKQFDSPVVWKIYVENWYSMTCYFFITSQLASCFHRTRVLLLVYSRLVIHEIPLFFCGTRKFIATFHKPTLTIFYISLRSILALSSHLGVDLSQVPFPFRFTD